MIKYFRSTRRFFRWMVPVLLLMAVGAPAMAQAAASSVGTLTVERHGTQGPAVILIPGLESGPWVWQRTIANLRKNHVVYAVTLAGFDGVPAPAPEPKAGTPARPRRCRAAHVDRAAPYRQASAGGS